MSLAEYIEGSKFGVISFRAVDGQESKQQWELWLCLAAPKSSLEELEGALKLSMMELEVALGGVQVVREGGEEVGCGTGEWW